MEAIYRYGDKVSFVEAEDILTGTVVLAGYQVLHQEIVHLSVNGKIREYLSNDLKLKEIKESYNE